MARRALFVFDRDNWCYVFPSVVDATGKLEVNDVEAGEYMMFDHDGAVFDIQAEGLQIRLSPTDRPRWLSTRLHGDAPPTL